VDYSSSINLILDNSTRWNSAFLSIQRGLKLKTAVNIFINEHLDALGDDRLEEEDWQQLADVVDALEPFSYITLRLEGNPITGSHGAIWEALPALDLLLQHVETKRETLRQQRSQRSTPPSRNRRQIPHTPDISPLEVAYQNAWEKLRKYYRKTDDNFEIYAAATLLNPCLRKTYFTERWTDDSAAYVPRMIDVNKRLWERDYRQDTPMRPLFNSQSRLDSFLAGITQPRRQELDEFALYVEGQPAAYTDWSEYNIFEWWMQAPFPSLRQWAFDTLSVPAMSAEVERVFSQARRTLTRDRNLLNEENLEALQCLKHWLDHKIVAY
jgi:hAT family C-terminal dimerisation region